MSRTSVWRTGVNINDYSLVVQLYICLQIQDLEHAMRVQLWICLQLGDPARRSMIMSLYSTCAQIQDRSRLSMIQLYPNFNLCSDTRPFKMSLQQYTKAAGTWEEDPVWAVGQLQSSAVVLLLDSSTSRQKKVKWNEIYKMERQNYIVSSGAVSIISSGGILVRLVMHPI